MKILFLFAILILFVNSTFGQKADTTGSDFNVIVGKITDNNNVGLAGITIRLKGKTINVQTDAFGNFLIYASSKDSLVVVDLGYGVKGIPMFNSPNEVKNSNFKLSLAYKNITNVIGEHKTEMSINAFKFPPLGGYTTKVLSNQLFDKCKVLDDVNRKLVRSLESLGYDEMSYFIIPNGFALVTKIESINPDGSSIMNSERFSINESKSFSFFDFLAPQKGLFRLFAFLITDEPFKPNSRNADFSSTSIWSRVGYNVLPYNIRNTTFSSFYNCSVIVYEFRADRPNTPLKISKPIFSANEHLKYSKIFNVLSEK